jgi:hypothetical protein
MEKSGHGDGNQQKDEDGGGYEGKTMLLFKDNKVCVVMSTTPTSASALLISRTINSYCVMSNSLHQLWYVEQNSISRVAT